MPTSWNSWYVKCPFFKTDDGRSVIVCEGICDGCNVKLAFDRKKDFEIHVETFCKNYFERCEIHNVVMKKYED